VRRGQHPLPRFGVGVVERTRLGIDRRQFPSAQRVVEPVGEALFLLLLVAAQPIFVEIDAVVDQLLLEIGHGLQEGGHLLGVAEAHDCLDPGAVVPAAVEQADFTLGREMLDVALEIPLVALAFGWGGWGWAWGWRG